MKEKITLIIVLALFIVQSALAQAPSIEWSKCFGGTGGDVGRCIQQTKDSGYIIVGNAGSSNGDVYKNEGSSDFWIVKLNKFGDTNWTRVFGGTDPEYATAVQQTDDEGYIVIGQSSSNDGDFAGGRSGNYDCWIINLDKFGNTQWKKHYGGSGSDVPRDMLLTADSGFIVAGISSSNNGDVNGNHGSSDYWIFKLNKMGSIIWTKSYGGTGNDQAFSIYETNNGYLLAGQTDSKNGDVWGNHGKTDYWILKINSIGDTIWTKTFGGTEDDLGHYIKQTLDGGYIVGGCSQSNNGDVSAHHGDSSKADIWIVKLNSNRDIQWQKSLGGSQNEALYSTLLAFSMLETTDSAYLISTYTSSSDGDVISNNGSSDMWLLKLTKSGNIAWQKTFGGISVDYGHSIKPTYDGGYVVTGMAGANGGDISGSHGGADLWVIKFGEKTNSVNETLYSTLNVYPNPSNGSFTIDKAPIGAIVNIIDIMGNVIFNTEMLDEQIIINSTDFAKGIYILKIEKNGYIVCQKIIVQN